MEAVKVMAMTFLLCFMVTDSVMLASNIERVKKLENVQKSYMELNNKVLNQVIDELDRQKDIVNRLKLKADLEERELQSYSFDFEE